MASSSTNEVSFRYRYDEIEDLALHFHSDENVNNIIDPDPSGATFDVDDQHDLTRSYRLLIQNWDNCINHLGGRALD